MEQEAKQYILNDLKSRFGIAEDKISIAELHPTNFPPDAKLFRADKRGGHGNVYYNYVYVAGKYYCSSDEKGFEHLLAAQKLLAQPRWNAHQFAAVFLHLVVRDLQLVEAASELHLGAEDNQDDLAKRAEMIAPATLEITTHKAQAKFWTYQLRYRKLEYWQVQVAENYEVTYSRGSSPAE